MGKQVTVLSGFSAVLAPSPKGNKSYKAGDLIVFTDAEYAALANATKRALSTATTVAEPDRPAVDTTSRAVNTVSAATGTVALKVGVNRLTLTGNVTLTFPTTVASGNESEVEVFLTQDATGSRTVTLPAAAKNPGGTAATLSTAANKTDCLVFRTVDGGTTWFRVNSLIDLR